MELSGNNNQEKNIPFTDELNNVWRTKLKRKFKHISAKHIFAFSISILLIIGTFSALVLSQISQDLRQQAMGNPYDKCYYGVTSCSQINRHSADNCGDSCPLYAGACCGVEIKDDEKVCTPTTPVSFSCNNGILSACKSDGTGYVQSNCASGECFDAKKCKEVVKKQLSKENVTPSPSPTVSDRMLRELDRSEGLDCGNVPFGSIACLSSSGSNGGTFFVCGNGSGGWTTTSPIECGFGYRCEGGCVPDQRQQECLESVDSMLNTSVGSDFTGFIQTDFNDCPMPGSDFINYGNSGCTIFAVLNINTSISGRSTNILEFAEEHFPESAGPIPAEKGVEALQSLGYETERVHVSSESDLKLYLENGWEAAYIATTHPSDHIYAVRLDEGGNPVRIDSYPEYQNNGVIDQGVVSVTLVRRL